jgi:hypothetical protein
VEVLASAPLEFEVTVAEDQVEVSELNGAVSGR